MGAPEFDAVLQRAKLRRMVRSLAFYMTLDEIVADAVTTWSYERFPGQKPESDEALMRAVVFELSSAGIELGELTLFPAPSYGAMLPAELLGPWRIQLAIPELPATERFIYLARYGMNFPAAAIARWIGLEPHQVEQAAFRAIVRIRELCRELPA